MHAGNARKNLRLTGKNLFKSVVSKLWCFITFLTIGIVALILLTLWMTYNWTTIQNPNSPKQLTASYPPSVDNPHSVTLVTAYFLLNKSKHSPSEFEGWISNFLPIVQSPLVIFTQPQFLPLFTRLREGKPTHIITFQDVWDIPWLRRRGGELKSKYLNEQHEMDPEKRIYSPEQFAVMNSKPWFLAHVAREANAFKSSFFYWMDIGSVRKIIDNHALALSPSFPALSRVIQVFGGGERDPNFKKMNIFTLFKLNKKLKRPPSFKEMRMDYVIGGFFGGSAGAVDWFSQVFDAEHDALLDQGQFVMKDQILFNWISIKYPQNFITVCSCLQPELKKRCGNRWLYFQWWFNGGESGGKCQEAPLLQMTDFLEKAWKQ